MPVKTRHGSHDHAGNQFVPEGTFVACDTAAQWEVIRFCTEVRKLSINTRLPQGYIHIPPNGTTGAAKSMISSVSGMSMIHLVIMSYARCKQMITKPGSYHSPRRLQVDRKEPYA